MFHKKASGTAWPFFVFGLLGIGILAAGALLFAILFSRVDIGFNPSFPASSTTSPDMVSKAYGEALQDMNETLASADPNSAAVFLTEAEELLFRLRVPQEKLESHLHALLRLRTLAKNQAEYGGEKILEELKGIFDDLE